MNCRGTKYLLALTGFAALSAQALEVRQSPYDKIAERNLFQLGAVIAEPQTPLLPPKPLRKVTLTGITTILGKRLAFITIEGTKSQPAESVIISEGAAVDGIEMKEIDEKAGVVRVLNDSKLQILNFEPVKPSGREPVQIQVTFPAPTASVKAKFGAAMTPEEQTALIELQRIKFQQEGNPIHAILPPMDLNPNE
jgi:hypothetical protein